MRVCALERHDKTAILAAQFAGHRVVVNAAIVAALGVPAGILDACSATSRFRPARDSDDNRRGKP